MFDIKEVQKEAEKEVSEEKAETAKGKMKLKLREIQSAKKIVRNLEHEYELLLETFGGE